MSTDSALKVGADHLRRDAFLYVRQSSLRQVFENTGAPSASTRCASVRSRSAGRSSEVALGHAGIVLGLEVSRLARNNADWHRLLELAALSRTLILDEDGIYDPSHFNDAFCWV
jgi:DNA invertase Pin-like site-specific DNA recombinase